MLKRCELDLYRVLTGAQRSGATHYNPLEYTPGKVDR